MNIFKLVGSIFIKNDKANEDIDKTSKKAESMAEKVGSAFHKAGQKITSVGKAIAPVSAGMATALGASVKSASDFTNGMAKMSTLFDTQKVSVSDLSKQFINLSNKTGLASTELAEAGYQALSAGVDVNNAVSFVETAGNLAKAGFTSTSTAVDVLTTAMNAYGEQAGTAEEISNKLVRTQNLGKTTVDELASAMGKVIPTASAMGVNIDNLTSGYVALTKQGIATAEATTYMNSMMNELGDSGTKLGGVIKEKTGMSFQECMQSGMSLADVLQVTKQYADENGIAYNELWSSAEAGKAGLSILNGGVEEFNNTVGIMASKTDDVGEALNKLETPSVKVKKSLNQVKNAGIELGTTIMSALAPTLEKVTGLIEKATTWFSSLDEKTKQNIATAMALVAGLSPVLMIIGKLVGSVSTVISIGTKVISVVKTIAVGAKALWAILMANPIGLVIGLLVALVAGFVALWNNCEGFRQFWIDLWEVIKQKTSEVVEAIKTFFTDMWTKITEIFNSVKETVQSAWETIKNIVQVGVMLIAEILQTAFELITLPFRFIWENCKEIVTNAWNTIKEKISTVMNTIKEIITNIWNAIKSVITPILNAIKTFISNTWNNVKTVITNVLNTIKSIVTTVWDAIKSKITTVLNAIKSVVTSVLNAVKSVFTSIWDSVKSKVSSVIEGIKSTISSGLNSAKSVVSSVLESIKSKFSSIWNSAKSIVSGAIEKIKSFMNFSWSLPKIKLPHFNISGKFSLNPPSIPHFSVSWYKKAMEEPYMFTKPTLFNVNPLTGQAKGAGEAGDEIMYGHSNLMNDIQDAVGHHDNLIVKALNDWFEQLFAIFEEWFPEFKGQLVLDTGALVAETAPAMDEELGKIIRRKERQ